MAHEARDQEERATRDQAALMKLPYCDTRIEGMFSKLPGVMDLTSMEHYHVVPLRRDGNHLFIGLTVKTPKSALEELRVHFENMITDFEVISESAYQELFKSYQPIKKVDLGVVNIADAGASATLADVSLRLDQVRADEAFRFLMTQAIALEVSDVHIEPSRHGVRIRFRLDGMLHQVAVLSHDKHALLEMELATRAGVKRMVNIPQSGRFAQAYFDRAGLPQNMNMRVETMPVLFGTETVIRLFNVDTSRLRLERLELDPARLEHIKTLISRPYGLVLVVGPTGSGKTTMLYTFINELNSPQRKIITLEDPIEYELEGVTQVPVRAEDSTFALRLEGVLREDPDVIMIGEIRNFDTARTALQAALTGHLVLSTFHAGSAAAAMTRLLDMIQFNPLLSGAIRMIIAQRLVRVLCGACKKPVEPSGAVRHLITSELGNLPEAERPDLTKLTVYEAVGCKECKGLGYKGRTAVRELLVVTPEMEQVITHQGIGMSTQSLEAEAVKHGMRTLLQDALLKVLAGVTSLDELSRTTDIR